MARGGVLDQLVIAEPQAPSVLPSSKGWRGRGWPLSPSRRLSLSPRPRGDETNLLAWRNPCGDGGGDRFHHAVESVADVGIPEADDTPAVGFKGSRAPFIGRAFGMVGPIDLDDQPRPAAGEVRDVRPEPQLSGEARANATQRTPERFLGGSRVVAQRTREMETALRFGGHEVGHPLAPSTKAWRGWFASIHMLPAVDAQRRAGDEPAFLGGQEGARAGITVNAIAPGYIDTDMVAAVPPDVLETIVAKIPVGRLGQASEIARGVTFLCAEEGGFITGSTLSINGGQHMY